MASVALAEDSSSVSVNSRILLRKTEWASTGILKVYPEGGPSFFLRLSYLGEVLANVLTGVSLTEEPLELTERESEDVYLFARVFLAERAALEYLARAEHSRYQLTLKLRKKGFSPQEIEPALDFLESVGSLDDSRYAESWLRSRSIHQCEGRQRMLAGLLSRGIDSKTAASALDSHFLGVSERDLCQKALEKATRMGKTGNKLEMALIRKGFCRKTIVDCMKRL